MCDCDRMLHAPLPWYEWRVCCVISTDWMWITCQTVTRLDWIGFSGFKTEKAYQCNIRFFTCRLMFPHIANSMFPERVFCHSNCCFNFEFTSSIIRYPAAEIFVLLQLFQYCTTIAMIFAMRYSYDSTVLGVVILPARLSVCLFVRPSVTRMLCDKTK